MPEGLIRVMPIKPSSRSDEIKETCQLRHYDWNLFRNGLRVSKPGVMPSLLLFDAVLLAREEKITDRHEGGGAQDKKDEDQNVSFGGEPDKMDQVEEEHSRYGTKKPEPQEKAYQ
jgi:hypothetical protein